jgi:hypothetical protein
LKKALFFPWLVAVAFLASCSTAATPRRLPFAQAPPGKQAAPREFVLARAKEVFSNPTEYVWREHDGSGLPIKMTFEKYFERLGLDELALGFPRNGFEVVPGRNHS